MREMTGDAIKLETVLVVEASVGPVVSRGPAPAGRRRVVAILGGTVEGDGIRGEIVPGGEDWQTLRADGVLEIEAHYVVRLEDGALVEILSQGYRHGPPEVMERLARGESVRADEYFFRTLMR